MTNTNELANESSRPESRQPAGEDRALRPPVDISEDADGITLIADMPGVTRDTLSIQVDGEALTVEGRAALSIPDGTEPLHADVRSTAYRRTFTLSQELDANGIDAKLSHGVLRLRIPKRAEVRPRKIEVSIG